jgi:hypothetical protein
MLKLSDQLTLPLEAVTGTFAILAIRGVGKTHTASVMAEEMLAVGQPIVAYDPTGAWWGLKSSADGKRPAFPVVVFGGEHADVPLEETAGDTVATTIVEKRIPAILDVSLLRKGARVRFMTDFCESLYHKNREPLHFFADEAQTIAPQNIRAMPEATRLLGAVEDIILQGRRRGLGFTAISPRPALVNTNIRSACQTLVAMRIQGPHDRKAILEWIEAHGDQERAKELLASLASLPKGDAWVWSPPDDIFKRVHFRERRTFDSSATPKVGGKIVTPQRMAQVDLNALGEAIKATVESAKANDPKALRARIAELERAAANKPQKSSGGEISQAAVEKAVLQAVTARDRELLPLIQERDRLIAGLKAKIGKAIAMLDVGEAAVTTVPARPKPLPISPAKPRPAEVARPTTSMVRANGSLTNPQQKIIDTVAMLEARGLDISMDRIARWLDLHPRGGSFRDNLRALSNAGHLDDLKLTASGVAAAQPPSTGLGGAFEALPDYSKRRMLQAIVDAKSLSVEDLAAALNVHPRGGSFRDNLRRLRVMGLVTDTEPVEPTEGLFR